MERNLKYVELYIVILLNSVQNEKDYTTSSKKYSNTVIVKIQNLIYNRLH